MTIEHIKVGDWQQGPQLKQQLLQMGNLCGSCCSFLDSHKYPSVEPGGEFIWAAAEMDIITLRTGDNPALLDAFLQKHSGKWLFGHIGYDAKSILQAHACTHKDQIGFPEIQFFVPAYCLVANQNKLQVISQDPKVPAKKLWQLIRETEVAEEVLLHELEMKPRMEKAAYLEAIEKVRAHILRGDCYELNFCHEFFVEEANIDPVAVYQRLVKASPNPFSCYYRSSNAHLMCASPERYLAKRGNRLISQPIKGTAARYPNAPEVDALQKENLLNSSKERSENVMVVDLVRNDLSRICTEGSVEVTELFGIYTFPQLHQMISTVEGQLSPEVPFSQILKASFPMGSMTGAPKLRVMDLIEKYEISARGLFSGSVGYITPNGDFDFNVVIRSLLYNARTQYLSYLVGGGITWYSDAEKEYEECLLKASAIRKALGSEMVKLHEA